MYFLQSWLEGRHKNIPYEEHLCPCEAGVGETVGHVLLYCSFYTGLCETFIPPILQSIPGGDDESTIRVICWQTSVHQ